VLPALTHTCTATTGEEWFSRITTVKPFSNRYFSINPAPSGAGVAPAAAAANMTHPARSAGNILMAIILSEDYGRPPVFPPKDVLKQGLVPSGGKTPLIITGKGRRPSEVVRRGIYG
jgi:hypothetical protein